MEEKRRRRGGELSPQLMSQGLVCNGSRGRKRGRETGSQEGLIGIYF